MNRFLLLKMKGHKVDSAYTGKSALEKIKRTGYDLIITDIKMPEMSGMDIYKSIKEDRPELNKHFLFLTGDTVNNGTEEFLRETGNTYLAKPFTIKELLEVVDSVLVASQDEECQ